MDRDAFKISADFARQIMQTTTVAETLMVLRREFPDVTDAAAAALHDKFHAADDAEELSDEALSAIAGGVAGLQSNGEYWVYTQTVSGMVVTAYTDSNKTTVLRSWTE